MSQVNLPNNTNQNTLILDLTKFFFTKEDDEMVLSENFYSMLINLLPMEQKNKIIEEEVKTRTGKNKDRNDIINLEKTERDKINNELLKNAKSSIENLENFFNTIVTSEGIKNVKFKNVSLISLKNVFSGISKELNIKVDTLKNAYSADRKASNIYNSMLESLNEIIIKAFKSSMSDSKEALVNLDLFDNNYNILKDTANEKKSSILVEFIKYHSEPIKKALIGNKVASNNNHLIGTNIHFLFSKYENNTAEKKYLQRVNEIKTIVENKNNNNNIRNSNASNTTKCTVLEYNKINDIKASLPKIEQKFNHTLQDLKISEKLLKQYIPKDQNPLSSDSDWEPVHEIDTSIKNKIKNNRTQNIPKELKKQLQAAAEKQKNKQSISSISNDNLNELLKKYKNTNETSKVSIKKEEKKEQEEEFSGTFTFKPQQLKPQLKEEEKENNEKSKLINNSESNKSQFQSQHSIKEKIVINDSINSKGGISITEKENSHNYSDDFEVESKEESKKNQSLKSSSNSKKENSNIQNNKQNKHTLFSDMPNNLYINKSQIQQQKNQPPIQVVQPKQQAEQQQIIQQKVLKQPLKNQQPQPKQKQTSKPQPIQVVQPRIKEQKTTDTTHLDKLFNLLLKKWNSSPNMLQSLMPKEAELKKVKTILLALSNNKTDSNSRSNPEHEIFYRIFQTARSEHRVSMNAGPINSFEQFVKAVISKHKKVKEQKQEKEAKMIKAPSCSLARNKQEVLKN